MHTKLEYVKQYDIHLEHIYLQFVTIESFLKNTRFFPPMFP